MYKQIDNFYRCYNRDDFISFVVKAEKDFDSIEDSEDYFGYHLNSDEDTGELLETVSEWAKYNKFRYEPETYPCTIIYINEVDHDRFGKNVCIFFDCVEDKEWSDYDDTIPTRKEGSE